jgi:hypothetical protein
MKPNFTFTSKSASEDPALGENVALIYGYITLTGCVISHKVQNCFNVMEREGRQTNKGAGKKDGRGSGKKIRTGQ